MPGFPWDALLVARIAIVGVVMVMVVPRGAGAVHAVLGASFPVAPFVYDGVVALAREFVCSFPAREGAECRRGRTRRRGWSCCPPRRCPVVAIAILSSV